MVTTNCNLRTPHASHVYLRANVSSGLEHWTCYCPGVPSEAQRKRGKLRFDLIPARPMHEVALAFTVGAEKHGDTDWLENPKPIAHHVGSLLRHLYAFLAGEDRDADGQRHLASVATRALMIMELIERRGRDERK